MSEANPRERITSAVRAMLDVKVVDPEVLTPRELEVYLERLAGRLPTQIAARLGLSVKTVSTYQTRIREKLGLPDIGSAFVAYAIRVAMRNFVVTVERLQAGAKVTTYLQEVKTLEEATHWVASDGAYAAMAAYGETLAKKGPAARREVFMEAVDLRNVAKAAA